MWLPTHAWLTWDFFLIDNLSVFPSSSPGQVVIASCFSRLYLSSVHWAVPDIVFFFDYLTTNFQCGDGNFRKIVVVRILKFNREPFGFCKNKLHKTLITCSNRYFHFGCGVSSFLHRKDKWRGNISITSLWTNCRKYCWLKIIID